MSIYLPEGWSQEKIDDILEWQRQEKIYYCRECCDWVQDKPVKHICEANRIMVEKSGNRHNS
jgi:hypothetical protein